MWRCVNSRFRAYINDGFVGPVPGRATGAESYREETRLQSCQHLGGKNSKLNARLYFFCDSMSCQPGTGIRGVMVRPPRLLNSSGVRRKHRIRLVPVVIRLVGTIQRDLDVSGLFLCESGKVCVDLFQMQACNLFVKMLGQYVNLVLVLVRIVP